MDTEWSEVSFLPFLQFQATASFLETSISYPLDVLKTRQQAFSGPPWTRNAATYARATVRNFGIREFFHGFRFAVVGGIPSEVGYYVTYNEVKKRCGNHVWGHVIAGGAAEISVLALWVPMDVISQRQQLEHIKHRYHWWPRSTATRKAPLHHRLWYGTHGHLHAGVESTGFRMWSHMKNEWIAQNVPADTPRTGWRWQLRQAQGLVHPVYRGTAITTLVQVPQGAVYWATYEQAKKRTGSLFGETYFASGVAGFIAGTTSVTVTCPLDVIKTRYQMTQETTLWETVVGTARDRATGESIFLPFFRGITFRVLSFAPKSALSFIMYEGAMYYASAK